jgi:hypothetical protein
MADTFIQIDGDSAQWILNDGGAMQTAGETINMAGEACAM